MENKSKNKDRGIQRKLKYNVKLNFDNEIILDRDFTTLYQIAEKFNCSYNTIRSLSCGRCKGKNPIIKNLIISKI